MRTLETTYTVRGETVTVVTEPLRTRKATHTEHTKRCKSAVQMLYSNAAPAWVAELSTDRRVYLPNWVGHVSISVRSRIADVEAKARGQRMRSMRPPLPLRWVG